MKVIICARGNVRSATTAAVLRDCYGETDVVAIGVETMTPYLLGGIALPLVVWIVGDTSVCERFAAVYPRIPFTHIDVGEDTWGMPMHLDLVNTILRRLVFQMGYPQTSPAFGTITNYLWAVQSAWHKIGHEWFMPDCENIMRAQGKLKE